MIRTGVITDELWELIEPVLPSDVGRRGRRWRDHWQVLEAIGWRFRTGAPRRDVPAESGPWQPCGSGIAAGQVMAPIRLSSSICWPGRKRGQAGLAGVGGFDHRAGASAFGGCARREPRRGGE